MTDKWSERRQIERRRERAEAAAGLRALCERSADPAPYDELAALILRALKAGAFPDKAIQLLSSRMRPSGRLPESAPPQVPSRLTYRWQNRRVRALGPSWGFWWGEVVREVSPLNWTSPQYDWRDHAAAIADVIERGPPKKQSRGKAREKTEPKKKNRRRRKLNAEEQAKQKEKRKEREERAKQDKRLWIAWKRGKGQFSTFEQLAAEFGIERLDAKLAIDRERKRLKNTGK